MFLSMLAQGNEAHPGKNPKLSHVDSYNLEQPVPLILHGE